MQKESRNILFYNKLWRLENRLKVADTYIKKGDVIKEKMIGVKRPSGGVSPKYIDEIIGKKAKRDIKIDEQIAWEDLESL